MENPYQAQAAAAAAAASGGDLSERSTESSFDRFDRPEASESFVMYEMEHNRSQSMTDVPIPQEKGKSKHLRSRMARGVKKAFKGGESYYSSSKKTRSLSPPQDRQKIMTTRSQDDDLHHLTSLPLLVGEPKKKHKSKFKPVAKAAAAAARKISGTKKSSSSSSNRDRTQSEGGDSSSRSSTPTTSHMGPAPLPPGKTPVNTPVNATAILDRPIPEELMEECQTSLLANMKSNHSQNDNDNDYDNSNNTTSVEASESAEASSEAPEASMEFVPSPIMDDAAVTTGASAEGMATTVAANTNNISNNELTATSPSLSAEDEALKLAEAMALAVKDNPNMSHEEIRKLVTSQPQYQQMMQLGASTSTTNSNNSGNSHSTKTLLKKNFMNFQEKFTSGTNTARGKFKEMMGSTNLDLGGSVTSFVYSKAATPKQPTETMSAATPVDAMEYSQSSSTGTLLQNSSSGFVSVTQVTTTNTEQEDTKTEATMVQAPNTSTTTKPTKEPNTLLPEKQEKPASNVSVTTAPHQVPAPEMKSVPPPVPASSPSRVSATVNNNLNNKLQPPIRLTDIVWKRRSGLGKYSTSSAWERRRMVLRGSQLLYYRAQGEGDSVGGVLPPDDSVHTGEDFPSQQQQQTQTQSQTMNSSISTIGGSDKQAAVKSYAGRSMMDALERASNTLGLSTASVTPAYLTSASKADARGYMDLVKEGATVSATTGHSGAPSPFCLSIKVRGETKWKLCFSSHKAQMEWLAALTDVAIQASVDAYNVELLSAVDPGNPGMASALYHNHVFEPPGEENASAKPSMSPQAGHVVPEIDNSLPQPKLLSSGHRLWMMEPYNIQGALNNNQAGDEESSTTSMDNGTDESEGSIVEFDSSGHGAMDEWGHIAIAESDEKIWVLPEKNFTLAGVLINAAVLYARNSSISVQGFWTIVVIVNMCLYTCMEALQAPGARTGSPAVGRSRLGRRGSRGSRKKKGEAGAGGEGSGIKGGASGPMGKADSFIPDAGMSTLRIENPHDLATNAKGQVFAGWRAPTGEDIHVRSHGYMETKAKIPSPGTLYELNQMDIFESPSRYPDMAPRVKLPKLTYDIDPNETKTWRAPDYFVVSVALPTDPPKLAKSSSDGGGYTLTMYFTMRKEVRDVLKRVTAEDYNPADEPVPEDRNKSIVNAVRLFEEWCRRAPNDLPFQARFKMIPYVENAKEIGLPSWIAKYNAKPLLIKRPGQTGFLFTHPELSCIEFDISLHVFPYLAKQGICYLKDTMFKKILSSVAFVIEGRDDDELPECLIGIVQVCYPDPAVAIQAKDFFAGTAPRSYEREESAPKPTIDADPALGTGAAEPAAVVQPAASL